MLDGILHGHTKPEVLNPLTYCNLALTPEILSLFPITPESIEALSGSDHVVEGLKMVLHCFKKTNNYQEGLLLCLKSSLNPAPISALYGQLAGAYYGLTDIKSDWITLLKRPAPILNFAEKINKRIHI
jgi:ADP-ribosylglycohydrolase